MSDSHYIDRVKESYGESLAELSNRYSTSNVQVGLSDYVRAHPARTAALVTASAVAIGAGVHQWGFVVTLAQAVGVAAFLLARESATFKEHRHILALASISCFASTAQQAIMAGTADNPGAYLPGGIMLAHAAATLTAFAVIPETKKAFRQAVTWGGGIAGAGAAGYLSYQYESGSGFIPAATTLANAVAFSVKDDNTPRARVAYIGLNLGHLFYWVTQPVASLALAATEAMYVATHAITTAEHDVPVADRETGRRYGLRERLSLYFNDVLLKGKRATDLGITQAEQGWERPDDRFYVRMRKVVFGA